MAPSAALEKAWAFTVTLRVSSPRPSTLTRAPLWVRPLACRTSGVTSSSPVASMVSRLMAWYSTRNGLLNPLSLGMRMCSGICPPSKLVGTVSRAFWPLVPRPAVLPPLPPMPRPTRLRDRFEPSAGLRSWTLMVICLLLRFGDVDEVGDLGDHPPDLGPVGQHVALADAPEAEGPEGALVLGLGADRGADLGDLDVGHQPTCSGSSRARSLSR